MSELIQYKCPCCGGKMEFNSTDQKMQCPFCQTEFELDTLRSYDEVLSEQPGESSMDWESEAGSEWEQGETENLRIYKCQSCGGEVVADQTTAASKCPYCDNPVIMAGQLSGDLKPDLIIPFKLDKEAAKQSLMKHMEGKPLLPKVFKAQNHIDEIKGLYVPVWLFHADVEANIQYRAEKHKTWSDQQYNYTERKFFSVTRAGTLAFDNVPVDGSAKMDDTMMESLEPFDSKQAVPFQTAYLSGYMADKYDVTAEASKDRANERIRRSTLQEFAKTVQGYSVVNVEHEHIHLKNGDAKYALYPVWILNTSWNGQNYTFAMNGQTGKFVGDLPSDKGKAWAIFFAVTVGVTVAAIVLGKLFGMI